MTEPRTDPEVADPADRPIVEPPPDPEDEDDDDLRELHRVYDDERSGPRRGRRIEWRDSGDRDLVRGRNG